MFISKNLGEVVWILSPIKVSRHNGINVTRPGYHEVDNYTHPSSEVVPTTDSNLIYNCKNSIVLPRPNFVDLDKSTHVWYFQDESNISHCNHTHARVATTRHSSIIPQTHVLGDVTLDNSRRGCMDFVTNEN